MSFNGPQTIKITHVINPHLFFFKVQNQIDSEVHYIERELKKFVVKYRDEKCATNNDSEYFVGDFVALYVVSQNKWIRAEIDVVDEDKSEIIVWATDYGFPLITPLNLVILLNDELTNLCHATKPKIFKGGMSDILPATSRYDGIENVVRMIIKENWEQDCVSHMERLKDSNIQMNFTPQFEAENHTFGILEIQNRENKTRCFGDFLANDVKFASKVSFEKAKREIVEGRSRATWKLERWLNNCGQLNCVENKIVVKKDNISIGSTSQCSQSPESSSSNSTVIDQNEIIRQYVSKMQVAKNNVASSRTAEEKRENQLIVRNSTISHKPTQKPSISQQFQSEPNTLINSSTLIRILARNNTIEPIELSSVCFTDSIFKGMNKLNFRESYASQRYAWPNLTRGNSLVLVDSQNRGKTVAYLPAICSKVERALNNPKQNSMGTIAIIVCLTANVPKIATLCETFLQMPVFKCNVVKAIGKRDTVSVVMKLYNGCNILVTTAPCLKELLTKYSNGIKTDRLECVAFENIDCIMEKHREACSYIVKELCSRKCNKGVHRQIIVTSRTWQPFLYQFLKENLIADSVLLIGNYLEAAFYGRVAFEFIPTEAKLTALADKVKALPIRLQKTMILCNSFDEAETVVKFLRSIDIPTDLVKNIGTDYAKLKVYSFWTKMEGVLVCADEHLQDTGIADAQNIIHYSVPENEFRTFLFRFSAMLEYYCEVTEKPMATSTIFIDQSNQKHLPKFVDLLKRFNQEITPELEAASQKARSMNMMERANNIRFSPICNHVLLHGTSDHQADCRKRHKLLKSDILEDESNKIDCGTVRFHVLNIISPSEYIVRPTELQTDENTWKQIEGSNKFVILDAKIQAFYKNANNTKSLIALNLGEKCCIERDNKFYRGEIIEIFSKRHPTDVERCNVRFLDTGDIQQYQAHEIYALDEAFQKIPNQAYYLHLTGIVPADLEDDWDPRAVEFVTKELQKYTESENSDVIYEANVILSLRHTLVVDIMRLVNIKRGVVHCSLKTFLRNKSYGIISPDSPKKVLALAKKEGLKLTEKPKCITKKPNSIQSSTPKSDDSKVQAQNGFESFSGEEIGNSNSNSNSNCNQDDSAESSWEEEINERWANPWKAQHKNVIISQFNSPNDFFIYQKSPQLRQLYSAIDEYVKANIASTMDRSLNLDIDEYCLVRVDGLFNRGKIFEVHFNESIVKLEVFLVDTGLKVKVEQSDVFDISDSLIEMAPFQAIWCNLVGIKPMGGRWTDEMNDIIYEAIDQYGLDLHLHTIRADKSIKFELTNTPIVRHDIVLVAVHEDEEININKMMVAMKLVETDPQTFNDLEDVPQIMDNDDDWDDEIVENQIIPAQNVPAQLAEEQKENDFFTHFSDVPPEDFLNFFEEAFKVQENQAQAQAKPNQLQKIEECDEETEPINGKDNGYGSFEEDIRNSHLNSSASSEEGVQISSSEKCTQISHQIEYIYKRPKVNWWQTEEKIVLRINAHENVKYGLEVTSDYLVYSTKENDEQIMAYVNLFGSVEFERTTHYVRGLNVIIHLHKSYHILWPRLLSTAEKCTWVIQNFEAMPSEEAAGYKEKDEKLCPDFDSDEEDDDEEKDEYCLLDPSDEGDDGLNDVETESI